MSKLKVRVAGVWLDVIPGSPGPTGPTGPVATFYKQDAEPSGSFINGQFWYDSDDNTSTLVGPTGPTGPTGPPGSGATETVNNVTTSGSAQTIPDVSSATLNRIVLSVDCTFTFPTAAAGKSFTLILVQDATGGRVAIWPGTVQWVGMYGSVPVLTVAPNKADVFSFTCADGTNWLGAWAGSTT